MHYPRGKDIRAGGQRSRRPFSTIRGVYSTVRLLLESWGDDSLHGWLRRDVSDTVGLEAREASTAFVCSRARFSDSMALISSKEGTPGIGGVGLVGGADDVAVRRELHTSHDLFAVSEVRDLLSGWRVTEHDRSSAIASCDQPRRWVRGLHSDKGDLFE